VASDARLKKIVLTEKAINIHKSVLKSINEREERLRQNLSDQEIETFLKITDKLIKNMEDSND
jgi:DNA-binding MarR family transcriptional regulator